MTNTPLVSILMPAYNAEKFISEAIESVVNQDYLNWELLILDDASTDSTPQIIQTFQDRRIRIFSHQENMGYLLSCNELFEKAEGDFITFLDADDTCEPNRISICLSAFEADSELDFITTNHIRTDEAGETVSEHRIEIDYGRYASDPTYYPTICCATIFLRKEMLEKVGGYHPFFRELGGEDYHWLFRLCRVGKGKHLQASLYNYRQHSEQSHIQNTEPLKYFIMDILQDIRTADLSGSDLLANTDMLKNRWKLKLNAEPATLFLRKASDALNRNRKSDFWRFWKQAVFSPPHSTSKLRQAVYLLYSRLARIA